jgi:hypothetical protein
MTSNLVFWVIATFLLIFYVHFLRLGEIKTGNDLSGMMTIL